MKTASIRDLRTRFPQVRRLLEREGEVVVTDRGKPVIVLRNYDAHARSKKTPVDYLKRLRQHMPLSISRADRQALDEAARGER